MKFYYKDYKIVVYTYNRRDLFLGLEWIAVSGNHSNNFTHMLPGLHWAAINSIWATTLKKAEAGLITFLKLHEAYDQSS